MSQTTNTERVNTPHGPATVISRDSDPVLGDTIKVRLDDVTTTPGGVVRLKAAQVTPLDETPEQDRVAVRIKGRADEMINREREARTRLSALLQTNFGVTAQDMRQVLIAAADAKPWRTVLERAERAGIRDALASVREEVTRELIERGETHSTCGFTNEAAHLDREAARSFLRSTQIFASAPNPAPAA